MVSPLVWIEGILFLAYIILNGIYGYYYTYSYNLNDNIIIEEIITTLYSKLIYSFRNSTYCKSNEERLIIDKFDAVPEFCNCFGILMGYGKCGESMVNCKTISSINSQDYRKINSQYICVTKSDKSYIDFLRSDEIISGDKECPSNYKSCGIIHTLGRKLCVKNNDNCPIKIADIENNNDSSNQIVSLIKLRPNYPCIDPNEKNWNYQGDLSALTKFCTKSDVRYTKIDKFSTNLYVLYDENNILNFLPSYNATELKNSKIYFYVRNFFGIDKEKAINFSKEKIISAQENINNCNSAMRIVTIILFLPLVVLGGAASAGGNNDNIGIAILAIVGIYSIPISLIYFIVSIIIFVNNNRITSMLDIGSDIYMNSAIKALLAGSSINFWIPLITIILFPILIILGICALVDSK